MPENERVAAMAPPYASPATSSPQHQRRADAQVNDVTSTRYRLIGSERGRGLR